VEVDARPVVTAALVAGLLAGYGIAVPVGAVGTYLVSLTARTSFRVGAFAALGIASADGVYALVAVAGGSVLAPALQPFLVPLRWASAVVLVALAVRGGVSALRQYRTPANASGETPPGPVRAYIGLLGMTLLNPTTVVYFTALVLGSRTAAEPPEAVVFVVAAFVASASWQLVLAGGGAVLGRVLTSSRGRLVSALVSSLLIAGLAVRLVAG